MILTFRKMSQSRAFERRLPAYVLHEKPRAMVTSRDAGLTPVVVKL
jgi:hypothetical protein